MIAEVIHEYQEGRGMQYNLW